MAPFKPSGPIARWRLIYDILTAKDIDDSITYDDMAAVLDLDPVEDRHAIQMAVRRAAKEYEEVDLRALEPIPNRGYRIVEPEEHLRLAQGQQKRSQKALQRGHSKIVHVDRNGLAPDVRKAFEVVAQAFAMQMDFNRRTDIHQRRLEEAIQSVSQQSERSQEEIQELRERLERLERKDGEP